MNRHLSLRSGNPALTKNTFKNLEFSNSNKMTLEGTVNKTIIGLLLLFFSASYSYSNANTSFVWMGFIIGFVLAMITIFKKEWAPYTVPLYAIFEGLALGGISYVYASMYTGIVQQAIFLTFGIFGSLLFAYKTRIIKPTENFKLGIFAATGGIFLVYLVSFIMSFFGSGLSIMNPQNSSLISIGFSLFVVIIASLNLVLDFDFIEEASEVGAPKYMEWYGVFGLLVTLIWLYLEILRLLAKLNSRRN
ncbi:MAG: Bax inhibitor-1/YccA family protein [Pelagibacteraceae bacterium TMED246]|nr:MAG: Bax inhibitor-1/YccA family protein [Pelagibacteraceae bacterium TMED246]|tara:strand:+ start:7362 stop:8105 length:744 start_codon:yes stop_codon:yes gene_type:complete